MATKMAFNPIHRRPQPPRIVKGAGGYVYRQSEDGEIAILAVPKFALGGGSATLPAPRPVKNPSTAWMAITEEIGHYPKGGKDVVGGLGEAESVLPLVAALTGGALGYNYGSKGMSKGTSALIGGVGGFLFGRWLRPEVATSGVGFIAIGKKAKEHQQVKREFEKKEMARAEAKAKREAEFEAKEALIRDAELNKKMAELGLKVAPASAPTPTATAAKAAGLIQVGNIYNDVAPRIWAYNDCSDYQDCED